MKQGPPRVARQGQTRVDGEATTSTSSTCPRIISNKPRIHQQPTRRNTSVTKHTATEPPPTGESPRQTQNINKGSARAKPKGMATQPGRSRRLAAGPTSSPTLQDTRTRKGTGNKQSIGSRRNGIKQASRKRIESLICTHMQINAATPLPPLTQPTATKPRSKTTNDPQFTYNCVSSKGKPLSVSITQEEVALQPTAAPIIENTSWRCNGRIYGKTNINSPLAGITRGALNQLMGNVVLDELKRMEISASPLAL